MRYELYDTNGKMRNVEAALTPDQFRIMLSEFKTHCAEERLQYEYNHFVNWVKKNSGILISYSETSRPVRIDM
jgi:hypothetical protein